MSTFSSKNILKFSDNLSSAVDKLVEDEASEDKINLTLQEYSHPENIVNALQDGTPLDNIILNGEVDK